MLEYFVIQNKLYPVL